jgi:putative membrane protein
VTLFIGSGKMDISIERVHSAMKSQVRTSAYLLFLGGMALFTILIGYYGLREVAAALAVAGWGLIWVTLFHLVPLIVDALGWKFLLSDDHRPSFTVLVWARWIGESINGLLPAAQVGGDLAKARLITQRGVPGPISGASVVIGLTIGLLTQIIFTLVGAGLLLSSGAHEAVSIVLIGVGIMFLVVTGFYLLQRSGMFSKLARVLIRLGGDRDWQSLVGGAEILDNAIRSIYRNRGALLISGLWYLCGWIAGTGEVWLALYFLGMPVTVADAFLLESLGQAIRSAAFCIPGALGVQEGGFIVIGSLIGLGPELSLALSLAKRVRELLLGVPGLIVWQIAEGRELWLRFRKVIGNSS